MKYKVVNGNSKVIPLKRYQVQIRIQLWRSAFVFSLCFNILFALMLIAK